MSKENQSGSEQFEQLHRLRIKPDAVTEAVRTAWNGTLFGNQGNSEKQAVSPRQLFMIESAKNFAPSFETQQELEKWLSKLNPDTITSVIAEMPALADLVAANPAVLPAVEEAFVSLQGLPASDSELTTVQKEKIEKTGMSFLFEGVKRLTEIAAGLALVYTLITPNIVRGESKVQQNASIATNTNPEFGQLPDMSQQKNPSVVSENGIASNVEDGTPTEPIFNLTVAADSMNVRTGPGTANEIAGKKVAGEKIVLEPGSNIVIDGKPATLTAETAKQIVESEVKEVWIEIAPKAWIAFIHGGKNLADLIVTDATPISATSTVTETTPFSATGEAIGGNTPISPLKMSEILENIKTSGVFGIKTGLKMSRVGGIYIVKSTDGTQWKIGIENSLPVLLDSKGVKVAEMVVSGDTEVWEAVATTKPEVAIVDAPQIKQWRTQIEKSNELDLTGKEPAELRSSGPIKYIAVTTTDLGVVFFQNIGNKWRVIPEEPAYAEPAATPSAAEVEAQAEGGFNFTLENNTLKKIELTDKADAVITAELLLVLSKSPILSLIVGNTPEKALAWLEANDYTIPAGEFPVVVWLGAHVDTDLYSDPMGDRERANRGQTFWNDTHHSNAKTIYANEPINLRDIQIQILDPAKATDAKEMKNMAIWQGNTAGKIGTMMEVTAEGRVKFTAILNQEKLSNKVSEVIAHVQMMQAIRNLQFGTSAKNGASSSDKAYIAANQSLNGLTTWKGEEYVLRKPDTAILEIN